MQKEGHILPVKKVLFKYEQTLRQKVNYSKTTISFSQGVKNDIISHIAHCLDIREALPYHKHHRFLAVIGK